MKKENALCAEVQVTGEECNAQLAQDQGRLIEYKG